MLRKGKKKKRYVNFTRRLVTGHFQDERVQIERKTKKEIYDSFAYP